MMIRGDKALDNICDMISPEIQRQGAGVDLTVGSIGSFTEFGCIDFDNFNRTLPRVETVLPTQGIYHLLPGAYLVTFNETVSVPVDQVGRTLPRSSLLRCGATLGCALWDPGYRGKGQALLWVMNPKGLKLYLNARIAQISFETLDGVARPYAGVYQGAGIR